MGQARTRAARLRAQVRELEAFFSSIGVDDLAPGFYDSPALIEAERQNPSVLKAYAPSAAYTMSKLK
ncbi:MAG: hypothetical protein VR70_10790 [Rhodospirillaceae bacterium BRH_c57]|nr:MAG: hypothetical protein VR70_10790 [Rhodospirillaceae bacterium BRH_c57]